MRRFCPSVCSVLCSSAAKTGLMAFPYRSCAASNAAPEKEKKEEGASTEEKTPSSPAGEGEKNSGGKSVQLEKKGRHHPRLFKLMSREILEEQRRGDKVPCPKIPRGWQYSHIPGNQYFTMRKRIELEDGKIEELRAFCLMEIKDYELTYRIADGERDENAHYTFTLFISKPNSDCPGGLEFTLTCIDSELVLDAVAMHATQEGLEDSWGMTFEKSKRRDARYRGPSVNELDDDFADELINYLDDRGINNAFAEYMTEQSIFAEDQNYLHWLAQLRQFASKASLQRKSSTDKK